MDEIYYTLWHMTVSGWVKIVFGLTKDVADKLVDDLAKKNVGARVQALPDGVDPNQPEG